MRILTGIEGFSGKMEEIKSMHNNKDGKIQSEWKIFIILVKYELKASQNITTKTLTRKSVNIFHYIIFHKIKQLIDNTFMYLIIISNHIIYFLSAK